MMERAASALGSRFAIPDIVVGGLVLAAVTSLPNAVAAVYLAGRGRGAATLSTALNSNALNVTIGLLIPAAVTGLGRPSGQAALIAAWYTGLTAVVLVFAYRDRGIGRAAGILVIAAYLVFAGSLLNSNALNTTIGLLLPAAVIGLGRPDDQSTLIAAWYFGLTAVVLAFAYRDRGIRRAVGIVVIAAYLLFAASLLASAYTQLPKPQIATVAGLTAAVAFAALLVPRRRHAGDPEARPTPGLASGSGDRDQRGPARRRYQAMAASRNAGVPGHPGGISPRPDGNPCCPAGRSGGCGPSDWR